MKDAVSFQIFVAGMALVLGIQAILLTVTIASFDRMEDKSLLLEERVRNLEIRQAQGRLPFSIETPGPR